MGVSQSGHHTKEETLDDSNEGKPTTSSGKTKNVGPTLNNVGPPQDVKDEAVTRNTKKYDGAEETSVEEKTSEELTNDLQTYNKERRRKDKGSKARVIEDASVVCQRDCSKKVPPKDTSTTSGYVTKNRETQEEAKRRKRLTEVASYSLMDVLKQKDRHKLLNSDSVLVMNGSAFLSAMLKIHNAYRADHGVPPLKLNKELNKMSQKRAAALVRVVNRTSKMSILEGVPPVPSNVVENMYCAATDYRAVAGAALACAEWYSSSENYEYHNNSFNATIGKRKLAFMKMVWKSCREIGAGRVVSGSGKVIIVAFYFPKPNIPHGIQDNVLPPLRTKMTSSAPTTKPNETTIPDNKRWTAV